MKKLILTGLTAALLSTAAMADVTGYTPAVSGQPATAAGINANFDALIASINSNAARLDALESHDVSGKTYNYKEIAFLNAAETRGNINSEPGETSLRENGFARVGTLTVEGTFAFNGDGTVNVTASEREVEMFVNPISDIGVVNSGSGSDTGTWSQTGALVTVSFPDGFQLDFQVSKGANVITAMIKNEIELEETMSDDDGTYRRYSTETALAVGVLVDEE